MFHVKHYQRKKGGQRMKRQYKITELLNYIKDGGTQRINANSLIGSEYLLTVVNSFITPIKDTDGTAVDASLYSFIPRILDTTTHDTTLGYYLDTRYASDNTSKWTIRKYDSVADALDGVQEIACAHMLAKADDLARMYYALSLPYNPLYNKDATETHTETGTIKDTHDGEDNIRTLGTTQDATTHSDSGKRNGAILETATVTEETQSAPYNDNDYYNTGKVKTESPVMGTDTSATNEVDYTNSTQYGHTIEKLYNKTDTDRSFGNLGVTKSTELLQSEYDTRAKISFWNYLYKLCLDNQFMWGVEL